MGHIKLRYMLEQLDREIKQDCLTHLVNLLHQVESFYCLSLLLQSMEPAVLNPVNRQTPKSTVLNAVFPSVFICRHLWENLTGRVNQQETIS